MKHMTNQSDSAYARIDNIIEYILTVMQDNLFDGCAKVRLFKRAHNSYYILQLSVLLLISLFNFHDH